MSEETPSPQPPNPSPAAPAPHSGGRYDAAGAQQALTQAHKFDLGIIAAGIVALLASFMPFYTVSMAFMGASASGSANAWHGFFGWFGALLAFAGAVILLLHIVGTALPFPVRLAVLVAFGVAALCEVIALFVFPGGSISGMGMDTGHGFGYWLALLATLAGAALAFMRRSETV